MEQRDEAITNLEQKLYSSRNTPSEDHNPKLTRRESESVSTGWNEGGGETPKRKRRKGSLLDAILLSSIAFFILAIVLAVIIIERKINTITVAQGDISVLGPTVIPSGETINLQIQVANRNNVPLESVTVYVEYPPDTRSPNDPTRELLRDTREIGTIPAGGAESVDVSAIMFGKKGDDKDLTIHVEYRVPDSGAVFSTERGYRMKIENAPVALSVSSPREITSGQEAEFTVEVSANTTLSVEDLILVAEYPIGFSYLGASQQPIEDQSVWRIEDLEPGEKQIFSIRGTIDGESGDERIVTFSLGPDGGDHTLATVYAIEEEAVSISRPFIGLDVSVNGSWEATHVITPGKEVNATIVWRNNTDTRITDVILTASLTGTLFDPDSLHVRNAVYRASDQTITWNARTNPTFAVIDTGDKGEVDFKFKTRTAPQIGANSSEPTMNLVAKVEGKRIGTDQQAEYVETYITKTLTFETSLALNGSVMYFDGPIQNEGPIPPEVDETTTYTIELTLSDIFSDISNTIVSAVLPSNVEYIGQAPGQDEDIAYNPQTGGLVWRAGDIKTVPGIRKTAYVQVAATPTIYDEDRDMVLVKSLSVTADDTYSGSKIQVGSSPILTRNTNDSRMLEEGTRVER